LFRHCPGLSNIIRPRIITRRCPFCGEEVEFFEDEIEVRCSNCGRIVKREPTEICVTWCSYAKQCIDELEKNGLIDSLKAERIRNIIGRR